MSRDNVFNLRLSDEEMQWLKDYANSKQITPREILRDYIKGLPKLTNK